MPAPTTLEAYPRQIEAMQTAVEAPNGVKLRFPQKEQAVSFRRMCYKARAVWLDTTKDNSFSDLTITLSEVVNGDSSEWLLIITKPPKLNLETF